MGEGLGVLVIVLVVVGVAEVVVDPVEVGVIVLESLPERDAVGV